MSKKSYREIISAKILSPFLILLLLFLTSCTSWNAKDKSLLAYYVTLSSLDAYQTSQFKDRNDKKFEEGNPILADSNGAPDMERIVALKTLGTLCVWFIADRSPKHRTTILLAVNSLQGGVVLWNIKQW